MLVWAQNCHILHACWIVQGNLLPYVSPPTPHGNAWPTKCLKILTKVSRMSTNFILFRQYALREKCPIL